MRMPYKNLLNGTVFKAGLPKLAQEILQDSRGRKLWTIPQRLLTDKPYAEQVRKQVIQQKTHMLFWDLLAEALIFTNMRFITNAFTRKRTGKDQFTGESGVVAQEKLDALHQKEKEGQRFSERSKQLFNNAMALIIPPLIALSLKHAVLNPHNGAFWARGLRRMASGFDYNKGIFMGLGAFAVINGMQLLGYAMAARDRYELREKMVVQNIGNFIFFAGNAAWMQVLGRLFLGNSRLPAVRSIQEAMGKVAKTGATPAHIQKSAKLAATFYWLCFLLNNLSFAALVVATNKSTVKRVKDDASRIVPGGVPKLPSHHPSIPLRMQQPVASTPNAYRLSPVMFQPRFNPPHPVTGIYPSWPVAFPAAPGLYYNPRYFYPTSSAIPAFIGANPQTAFSPSF